MASCQSRPACTAWRARRWPLCCEGHKQCFVTDTRADIRGLVSDESIINDVVPEAFHDYNTQQMLTVDNGGTFCFGLARRARSYIACACLIRCVIDQITRW